MSRRAAVFPVVQSLSVDHVDLPAFRLVEQQFAVPPAIDVESALQREWRRLRDSVRLDPGADIAVAVGSRGIDRLQETVRLVLRELLDAGCRPFIVPAMGSHGGATAEGQLEVLASLGITEASMGVPLRATMDVIKVGEVAGTPLFVDRCVHEADGIVLINRVKPHTDFAGLMGSGLLKMLCVGLGNQVGADAYHRAALTDDLGEIIQRCGRELLRTLPVTFGAAVVENQDHRVCELRLIPAREIELVELLLQTQARALLPGLPLDDIDLLIVEEMGKNISGAGLDPNVIGRTIGRWSVQRTRPRIARILVRGLTAGSHGNASGLGFVDVATPRLIQAIDLDTTAVNAVTACMPEDARLPLTLPTERDAVAAALATVRPHGLEDVRIVHIANTSEVGRLLVSEGCLTALEGREGLEIGATRFWLEFDAQGNIVTPLNLRPGSPELP
jgi:Lactate racemase N-terminal domain